MPAFRRIVTSPHLVVLAGIVLLGALLRFATLDLQSYRYDEAVTVGRVSTIWTSPPTAAIWLSAASSVLA
jgi:hypothetical protein